MKFVQYPKYKDTPFDWIGKIPEGWEIRKIKHFAKMANGTTPDSGNERFWDGDIIWVTPADLSQRSKYISDSRRKLTKEGYASCGTEFVKKDSIILATRAPIGYVTMVGTKLCFNQGCKAFEIQKDFFPDYVYYYLKSFEDVLISNGNATTFSELSMYDLSSFQVTMPSLDEQKQIAKYLDVQTSKIDTAIDKDRQLIVLLEEERTALINHVVTRGLDEKVKLKNSGNNWVGLIPEEWKIKRLKFITIDHRQGFYTTEDYLENGIKMIRITDINDFSEINLEESPCVSISDKDRIFFKVKKGDFLFVRSGATIGKFGVFDNDSIAVFASYLIRFRFSNEICSSFLKYVFLSSYFKEALISNFHGGANINIHAENIKEQYIVYPVIQSEQKKIAKYLDEHVSKIDETVRKIQRRIYLLEDYKKSLINNTVTGKIDVREPNGPSSKILS